MIYRKKPTDVEAWQFDGKTLLAGMSKQDVFDQFKYQTRRFGVQTGRGFVTMDKGDWVLTHPGGELAICSDEDFKKYYEPAAMVEKDLGQEAIDLLQCLNVGGSLHPLIILPDGSHVIRDGIPAMEKLILELASSGKSKKKVSK